MPFEKQPKTLSNARRTAAPPGHAHILDQVSDIALAVDADGRIAYVNGRVGTILGWDPSDLVGSPLSLLLADFAAGPAVGDIPLEQPVPVSASCRDGSVRLLQATGMTARRDAPGTVLILSEKEDRERFTDRLVSRSLAALPLGEDGHGPLLAALADAWGAEAASLWLAEGPGQIRCTATWQGEEASPHDAGPAGEGDVLPLGEQLAGRVAVHLRPEWRAAPPTKPAGNVPNWEPANGFAFPLTSHGHLVGVVEFLRADTVVDIGLEEAAELLSEPLGSWCRQLRDDYDHLHLVGRLKLAEQRQRFLAEVSAVLASSLHSTTMLRELARSAVPAVADGCAIDLLDEDGSVRRVVSVVAGPTGPVDGGVLFEHDPAGPFDDGAVGRVISTGLSVMYPHVSDTFLRALLGDEARSGRPEAATRSAIIVPIPGTARTFGSLTLVTAESNRVYGHDDLGVAEDVGRRTGLALSAARLYERERSIAAALQEGLLPPRLPVIPTGQLSGRFRAGGEGVEVGGDFYDAFPVSDDRWMVGIGDVCGQGATAAAITARVRYSARAVAGRTGGPGELLERVNQLLMMDSEEVPFCTAAYAMVGRSDAGLEITVARAGHPFPLALRADGTVVTIHSSGAVLGVFDDLGIDEVDLELGPGDVFVLYTDGVTEARRGTELLGMDRLVGLLPPLAGRGAAVVAEAIEQQVLDFTGGRIRDDVAVMALGVEGGQK